MFRRATAAAAAVAACALIPLAFGMQAASAAVSRTTPAVSQSSDVAGYQLSGRDFRYVQTVFVLPTDTQCQAMAATSPDGFGAAITLGPAEESVSGVASPAASTVGVSMVPTAAGCGLISPSFASNLPGGAPQFPAGAITLNPGDTVKLALFYSQGNLTTRAQVFNLTAGTSATKFLSDSARYTTASVSAGFGPYAPAGVKSRLFLFKSSLATTYNGKHGSMTGPWGTTKIITINGGVTDARPAPLFNSGSAFGLYTF